MQDYRWPTYKPRGVTLETCVDAGEHGSVRLRDSEGKEYLDAVGGIGCAPIGHGHPAWAAAIESQLRKFSAAANSFWTQPQLELAAALRDRFPVEDGRVFLCNTGTEATEAAIKLAVRATGRDTLIAFERGFHGRSLGAISLTANPAYRKPYVACEGEDAEGFFATARVVRLPYGDLDAVKEAFASHADRVAAVFLEPIQGEGGIFPATRDFLVGLRELCSQHGALLGVDEIQSGCGRTGAWSAWESLVGSELKPDILWLAKALGGGFPVGACIASKTLAESMTPGTHGTTFGGNPAACAAALATIEIIEKEGLLASAGAQLGILREIAAANPIAKVSEIRGVGAMIGIQLDPEAAKAVAPLGGALMARGLLATTPGGTVVRLLFPYRAGREELGEVWNILRDLLG